MRWNKNNFKKQQIREFATDIPPLKEILRNLLQEKGKWSQKGLKCKEKQWAEKKSESIGKIETNIGW